MKKILITGCAGFIGSHITELFLSKGFKVIGIDNFDSFYSRSTKEYNLSFSLLNSNFTFIEGDLLNQQLLDGLENGITAVIHLAAKAGVRPSIENPSAYVSNNIQATLNILNWMNNRGLKKLLFASSSSIYGNNKKIPFAENDITDTPVSPYAFTKKSCELINHTYHDLYNFDIVNLRFFTVYGERQRPDLAIHKFTHLIMQDKAIPVFGDGLTGRDYTYIEDIKDGIYKAFLYLESNSDVFETFNLGNNKPVVLKELVHLLFKLAGKEPLIEVLPLQPGDVELTFADITKAKEMLNYSPSTGIEQGLKNFINWYNSVHVS